LTIRVFNQRFSFGELWKLRSGLYRSLLHPLKGANFILIALSRLLKRTRARGFPPFLMIEPTSRCDMACPMCFVRRNRERYALGDMTFANFRKVMDEVGPSLITLALWGYGEPLLNESLPGMIVYARRMGVFTSVTTNALSLTEEKADALIESGLDYLIVSLDGATEDTYAMYRSPGKFARVVENISVLTKRKKGKGRSNPFVNLQFIVMKGNEHEIGMVKKLARDLGVDKLSLKKAWVFTKEEEERILPSDPKFHLGIYGGELDGSICSRPWNTPLITWKGDVLVCCADFSYAHVMGNVFHEGGFRSVWNNEKYRAFRRQVIEDITKIGICRKCAAKNYADGFVED